MTAIVMALVVLLGLAVETAASPLPFFGFARVPALACVTAYYALNHSAPVMLASALLGGLLADSLFSLPPGVSALALTLCGAAVYCFRNSVIRGKPATNIVFGAALGAGCVVAVAFILIMVGRTYFFPQPVLLFARAFWSALAGAVAFPFIHTGMVKLERMTGVLAEVEHDYN